MLSRNVGNLLPTSQKGEQLDYATVEAWNLAENTDNFQCEMEIVQFVHSTAVVVILQLCYHTHSKYCTNEQPMAVALSATFCLR